jgi:hypothetical protein
MPFYLGSSNASSFAHYHDYEPAALNHYVPHHGIFSRVYFGRMVKSCVSQAGKYSSFTKNNGPPHWSIAATYDDLEHSDYLQKH